jgi:hypothetical protein
MGPPVFTYEQVLDFIERNALGTSENPTGYDKDLLIEFLKTSLGQSYIDKYYEDITDDILLDYLENQIYDEQLKSRIENCISFSRSKSKSITELKMSYLYLDNNFYKKNGLLEKVQKIVNQYKKN